MNEIKDRVDKLRSYMEDNSLDAFLVTKAENIRYLSGFTGGSDARLLISQDKCYILTDSRYFEQVNRECRDWELVEEKPPGFDRLVEISSRYKRISLEANSITYQFYQELSSKITSQLSPQVGIIENLRVIKDDKELDLLRKSAAISDEVFLDLLQFIKPGVSERQVAAKIGYLLKVKGCDKESFDTIAVSGKNAALPHGQPGPKLLVTGDMVTMDYGGFYRGYAGDMTRTVAVGETSERLIGYYHAVLEAQQIGVAMVKAGVCCREIDQSVRNCLKKYDLERYFQHGTGHGVGLEIHEEPRVSFTSDRVLTANMVITIEPGIYIPGWGGIRIEDTVIVKNGGCEIITHSDKSLLIL